MTVAAFMDLALYHPDFGYYARAARRTGRAGDFFTSVDVGPLFGRLLAIQIAEMSELLGVEASSRFDLVEAGAGDGRLAADILRPLRSSHPTLCDRLRLHLVEASAEARAAQPATLDEVADRLASSSSSLPESFEGVLVANELLDALPVHQVVMREDGLREVYVVPSPRPPASSPLTTIEGAPSTPALSEYLARLGITLEPGWRAEINLRAVDWISDAARRLRRGFLIVIDYGHEARELYSLGHSAGTLTTFARHVMAGADSPAWLARPGDQDMTAHVDFTSVRAAAEAEGSTTIALLDQTYFLLGLANLEGDAGLKDRLALKTLTLPGGLGSTHKVVVLGKGVGAPALRCCSLGQRLT